MNILKEKYQKVIQLIANETSNKTDNNIWKIVSNKNQRIRKTNLANETDHLVIPLNNVYEPLDVDFHKESSNERDEATLKETETQRNTNLSKINNIQRNITNRKKT